VRRAVPPSSLPGNAPRESLRSVLANWAQTEGLAWVYIFKAALDSKLIWLTVIGLLNSAVAAYYYLRILVVMYFREPGESVETLPPAGALLQIAVYGSAVGTLLLGIFPSLVLDFANRAAIR